jgi:hypothetical protein
MITNMVIYCVNTFWVSIGNSLWPPLTCRRFPAQSSSLIILKPKIPSYSTSFCAIFIATFVLGVYFLARSVDKF